MKSRHDLIRLLRRHRPHDAHEAAMLERIVTFVERYKKCFERSLLIGHVTGSAWVVDKMRTHTLLVHHARLDKWLQPGGHYDGDPSVLAVAVRETLEETGIAATPLTAAIFDVDAHEIPPRKNEPAHIHYDIRFFLQANREEAPVVSPESRDVRWVPLSDVPSLNTDQSVLRLVAKTHLPLPREEA